MISWVLEYGSYILVGSDPPCENPAIK